MADYNSPNTGVEIDAAVAATNEIMVFNQVYSGSPTNTGVAMSTISVNPGTSDKTGVYDVIYSSTATSVDSSSGEPNVSRIWIGDEAQTSHGSGHGGMTDTLILQNSANYDGNEFTAVLWDHSFSSGTATSNQLYIHKIFRLEKLA